jgi:hypothetical protein
VLTGRLVGDFSVRNPDHRDALRSTWERERGASESITRDPRGPSHNGAIAYLLHGAGNRMSRTSTLPAIASAVHDYDANDQLASYGYDPNGNTTSSGGDTFACPGTR